MILSICVLDVIMSSTSVNFVEHGTIETHFFEEVKTLTIILIFGEPDLLLNPCNFCTGFVEFLTKFEEFLVSFSECHSKSVVTLKGSFRGN